MAKITAASLSVEQASDIMIESVTEKQVQVGDMTLTWMNTPTEEGSGYASRVLIQSHSGDCALLSAH